MVNDDYAFYETGALASAAASGNSWAGASHWKFVGIKKKVRGMGRVSDFCGPRGRRREVLSIVVHGRSGVSLGRNVLMPCKWA